MPRALKVCSTPGCPELVAGSGRCSTCTSKAEAKRGSASARGYAGKHVSRFRRQVLARDRTCVLCQANPATQADHYPLSRRELVQQGLDPNDPKHGRGLCAGCHSRHTAAEQPGGWNL